MKKAILSILILPCLLLSGCPSPQPSSQYHSGSKTLSIAPVAQELSDWCWLASSQMIFKYFSVPAVNPDYQCGEIGLFFGVNSPCFFNCLVCDVSAGSVQNIALLLQGYPYAVQQLYPAQKVTQLSPTIIDGPLMPADIEQQIDLGSPILVGVTPTGAFRGAPSHAVVLVGYIAQQDQSTFEVVINDPYPYDLTLGPASDPYLQNQASEPRAGQFVINYDIFVYNLLWTQSVTVAPN